MKRYGINHYATPTKTKSNKHKATTTDATSATITSASPLIKTASTKRMQLQRTRGDPGTHRKPATRTANNPTASNS